MREKLIELLYHSGDECDQLFRTPQKGCHVCKYAKCGEKCINEMEADYLIANGVTIQQWIPVTERLPEETGKYIVCTAKGSVYCTKFYTKRFGTDSNTHITHWMPLPTPPKDGE